VFQVCKKKLPICEAMTIAAAACNAV